jgi:eukaryotic-like serine/threonine-protein kinase
MIFGKYQLLDLLGRGGMAEVFKAKSYGVEGFEKLLVIKRILPNLTDNDRFVEMFIDEAKIAVSLNHANVVQVFDLGKVGDSYYIAMEYVQGMDLAGVINACNSIKRAIPVELAAYIASEIAKGLDYAHRRRDQNLEPLNIVHRDISPHNILLSLEGEAKVTDFGIARAKNTLADDDGGVIKGKYAYMAPEQARGKPHDRRVDIFSLGVVLYETICGTNPLRGGQSTDILRRIRSKDYAVLSDLKDVSVPEELSRIVAKAMEPNPESRYSNSGEVYEDLIAFLYSTGTRVGAHTLSAFLDDLRKDTADDENTSSGIHQPLIAEFSGKTQTASSTTSASYEDDDSEVTSVQVPDKAEDRSPTTTSTGTRTLAAELREITVLAMEFIGPAVPTNVLDRFSKIIVNNGGAVIDERNDLLVGLFGLEVGDGRDTQDAIDTSLKLQRASMMYEDSLSLQIGVGVHPAKIVLVDDGTPREDDAFFTAVSDARNLAKRGIGRAITSETGRQLAADSFRFEEVTITSVGGSDIKVYDVVGRRPLAESYGKLFGRREELRTIGEGLAMVSRGSGRILALIGEAGTGKTRIIHEVRRRLLAGGHNVGWYEANCVPWRHSSPFAAVGAMFRSILAAGEIEPEEELKAKVERLRELGLIPEEVESVAFLLGITSDNDIGPEERGRQLRSALIRAASSLCADKMTVFYWDDLGHIDNESADIIYSLGRSLSHMPLLLALAFRPGFDNPWSGHPLYQEIGLNPLSESESKQLALSRIQARRAPEDLLVDIALKSGGNPLYIEEYVKALLANDIVTVQRGEAKYMPDSGLVDFPKTLRGLVGARIKRLSAEQRGLLQRAAVMGQRFNIELFSHVTGVEISELRPTLLGLKDVGLLNRISAVEFSFSSDLVRDVVYDGIILSDRREIHAAVARSIELKFSDRLDEFVERLAVHYREGGERAKAVEYLIRAGEKVASDFSHQTALDYYLKSLELLQNVPKPDLERILSVYIPIGELAIKTNNLEMGLEKMRLAEELAEDVSNERMLIQIMRLTAELQARSDRFVEAQQYFQRAIELADNLKDEELLREVRRTAGQVYIWLGDMKKAGLYYKEAIELSSPDTEANFMISCIANLAKAEANSGMGEQSLVTIERAHDLVDHKTEPQIRCEYEQARAQVFYMLRNIDKSISHNMKSLDIAKEYDLKDVVAKDAHNIGDAYLELGDYRKAYTFLRLSMEVSEEIGHELLINLNRIFLAFIDALKFGSNEGIARLEKALERANESNTVWEQLQVHFFLGKIHFEKKQYKPAKEHLEHSRRIGRAANNKIYDTQAIDLLAQINEFEDISKT